MNKKIVLLIFILIDFTCFLHGMHREKEQNLSTRRKKRTKSVENVILSPEGKKRVFRIRRDSLESKGDIDLANCSIETLSGIEMLLAKKIAYGDSQYSVEKVKELKFLDLFNNNIKVINNRSFQGFSNLLRLNLMNNKIKKIELDGLKGLVKLMTLSLDGNNLTKVDPKIFKHTPELNSLFLHNNFLTNTKELEVDIRGQFPKNHTITISLLPQRKRLKKASKKKSKTKSPKKGVRKVNKTESPKKKKKTSKRK